MLYREIIAVRSEIHTKYINTAMWAERRIVNVKMQYIQIQSVPRSKHIPSLLQKPVS